MQLNVVLYVDGKQEVGLPETVRKFDDRDKLAKAVASKVKRWITQVPLTAQGSRCRFDVYASWREGEALPPKKKGK